MEDAARVLQLVVNAAGAKCIYGLIAKWGMNYWLGGLLAIGITAVLGYFLDVVILRRVIGQPQFAVVMLALGLAFIFRAAAGFNWATTRSGSKRRSPTAR